jgi:hypothetical protein
LGEKLNQKSNYLSQDNNKKKSRKKLNLSKKKLTFIPKLKKESIYAKNQIQNSKGQQNISKKTEIQNLEKTTFSPKIAKKPIKYSLFTDKFEDFININESSPKNENKLSSLSSKEIKEIYNQQLLLDIPYIKVKSYFNCVSSHTMADALHDDSIFMVSEDFLQDKYKSMKETKYDSEDYKSEISKTFNFKLESNYNTNERIMSEMKKRITLRGIEDFRIDIHLIEKFFEVKIKQKNIKQNIMLYDKNLKKVSEEPLVRQKSKTIGMKKKQHLKISSSTILDSPQMQENFIKSNLQRFGNSILIPNQQEGDMAAFYNSMKTRNMSVIRKQSTNTDMFSNRNSFLVNQPNFPVEEPQINNNKVMYSFRDDMTMDNANFAQEDEYERTRLNSKSIIDMSKIDWSASVVSKNPSVFNPVIIKFLNLIPRVS